MFIFTSIIPRDTVARNDKNNRKRPILLSNLYISRVLKRFVTFLIPLNFTPSNSVGEGGWGRHAKMTNISVKYIVIVDVEQIVTFQIPAKCTIRISACGLGSVIGKTN